ncbi:hypothetical protein KQ874_03235 [Mycoplasma sp. ES3157-GEN-MYC]|uniref:Uncharacterized protein n=1 Tax=Mycoplasma miroungigenitalium TaxID=754515 RepID=A0A6M4JGJ8_9MOLU|nr:hypothetical protein [Mycoplasma miroungigenitalium]MBU4690690.1 hypothetical protein [Mycoplasma miroungigenitalium]MBU4691959.1 hypothetical protein [Mycoplasma miroungigenitalium]QJR43811.1 hypothetical protein HLA87_03430 [Mycoplasma miroungigenitalium]
MARQSYSDLDIDNNITESFVKCARRKKLNISLFVILILLIIAIIALISCVKLITPWWATLVSILILFLPALIINIYLNYVRFCLIIERIYRQDNPKVWTKYKPRYLSIIFDTKVALWTHNISHKKISKINKFDSYKLINLLANSN